MYFFLNNSINEITSSITSATMLDPFEMGDFGTVATPQDIANAIGQLDKRILEMKVKKKCFSFEFISMYV